MDIVQTRLFEIALNADRLAKLDQEKGMFHTSYDHKEAQFAYTERIRQAQVCHLEQRLMVRRLVQVTLRLSTWLKAQSDSLQERYSPETVMSDKL